jgi:hypothetical protein
VERVNVKYLELKSIKSRASSNDGVYINGIVALDLVPKLVGYILVKCLSLRRNMPYCNSYSGIRINILTGELAVLK